MAISSRSLKLAHVNYLGDFARIMRLWIFLQTFSLTYCKHGMGTVALRLLKQSPSQVKSDRIPKNSGRHPTPIKKAIELRRISIA